MTNTKSKMIDYKVVDNFLDKEYFNTLKNNITGSEFPWFYQYKLNDQQDDNDKDLCYYFAHTFYRNGPNSDFYNLVEPLWDTLKIKSLMRIKANCYPGTHNLITHPEHQDYFFDHNAAIIYLNTNDGYTILEDGTKIESVENRILFFNAAKKHSSSNCTNKKARFNININYF